MEITAVFIKSLRESGHFRAGVKHLPLETAWPVESFDDMQMALLQSDPFLEVSFGSLPEAVAAESARPASESVKPASKTAAKTPAKPKVGK